LFYTLKVLWEGTGK